MAAGLEAGCDADATEFELGLTERNVSSFNLAGHWQAVANLVTPNCCSCLGVLVAHNGAVIKTLVLESLLQRTNPLVGTHQTDSAQRDDKT